MPGIGNIDDKSKIQAKDYPRLMVLTGFCLDDSCGGAAILRSMLDGYPREKLLLCSVFGNSSQNRWWRTEVPRKIFSLRFPGKGRLIFRWIYGRMGCFIEAALAAKYALKAAKEFKADVCWIVLDFNLIFVADKFISGCKIPVHLSVHDEPVIASQITSYPVALDKVHRSLDKCIRSARSRDCISNRLAEEYLKEFGVSSFVLTKGIETENILGQRKSLKDKKKIKIVIGGNVSCPPRSSFWPENMLKAIDILNKSDGLQIELHIFDKSFPLRRDYVYLHGNISEPSFAQFLKEMDIGYAYDPLTENGRKFSFLSFPTKIISYVGAGLPFLYHGPEVSSVACLLSDYSAGILVESEDPEKIVFALRKIISNYERMESECVRLAREHFDINVLRRRIMNALKGVADEPDDIYKKLYFKKEGL